MKKRREGEAFSISFLDVITCGFGAIIFLLMIAKTGEPPALENVDTSMENQVRDLQVQLFEIRGDTRVLNRDLDAKQEQLSVWQEKIARLQSQLKYLLNKHDNMKDETAVTSIITGELELAVQELTDEMKRLLAQKNSVTPNLIGGIPVDSEYIIFVIDTSPSMKRYNWNRLINHMITTLDIYPKVKGLQILNDEGVYMFSQYKRKWIPDTPGRRRVFINTLRSWEPYSNSNPVEGIVQAIRDFYDPGKKISIYVYGDDFDRFSTREIVDIVDRLNPEDARGNRKIRIHAVGFPFPGNDPDGVNRNSRYAMAMRELAFKNGGTFVGLN